ncbi:caveolin-2 isoform X2 [Hemicordylus capensis]|uniref:caveolin-2 isoform X2 n=1 Tax=Hemicordylus capensis TaxID=884348 RepID=UPI002304AA6F|nr:caveolin-2 isoform X2 [Hemicordylus capensis]
MLITLTFIGSCADRMKMDQHCISKLCLGFDDVIAEPASTHSFDRVWICSHALFEISKYLIYKLLTLILAIPLALVAGILFAVLSCLHIWLVVPFIKSCLMILPSVQAVWKTMTDVFIAPVFHSVGKCFAAISIRFDQE